MTVDLNGIGTQNARMAGYDSTLLAWVASPPFSAGGGGGSTQVAVSSLAGIVAISGNSSVWQGSSAWQVQVTNQVSVKASSAADLNATVTPVAGSTWNVRAISSSRADFLNTIYQSTASELQATVTPAAGSTFNVRALNSSAADLQMTATPAAGSTWNTRTFCSSAADFNATVTPVAGSTWNTRTFCSSAADFNATVTPAAGSTFNTRTFCSSAADFNCQSRNADNLGNLIESSTTYDGILNSTRRGIVVRQAGVASTTASGQAATAGDNTLITSGATALYVYAFQLSALSGSTVSTAVQLCRFLNGSTTEMWRVRLFGGSTVSSAPQECNMAVSPPAYLFRTSTGNALLLNTSSSGVNYSIAAWRE